MITHDLPPTPLDGTGPGLRHLPGEIHALARRRLRHMLSAPGRLIGVILNPLVMLLVIGYLFVGAIKLPSGTENYLLFVVPGVALQVGLASLGPTAITMRTDLDSGVMERFRSLPVRRSSILLAHLIADTVLGVAVLAVVLAAAVGLGWRPVGGPFDLLLASALVVAFIVLTVTVGMMLGMVMARPESIDSVGALVLVVFSFLSTLLIAPELMQPWVRIISSVNPISLVADATRQLANGDAGGLGRALRVGAGLAATIVASVLALVALLSRARRSA